METLFDATEIHSFLIPSEDNVADIDPTAWYDNMTQDFAWCDHPFLILTAIYLKRKLIVLPIHPEDSPNGQTIIEHEGMEIDGEPFYFLNYSNVHFQSIFPKKIEESSTL